MVQARMRQQKPRYSNEYSLPKWFSAIIYFEIKDITICYTRNTNRYYLFELVSPGLSHMIWPIIKDAFHIFIVEIYYNPYWQFQFVVYLA